MKTSLVLRAATLLLAGCVLPGAWGAEATTVRPGAFDTIQITGSASVRFEQGPEDLVIVEGDADAQRSVRLEVRDGRLHVHNDGAWKFWAQRSLVIRARTLKRLVISGAAGFYAPQPVQGEQLSVAIAGSGSVKFDQLKVDSLQFVVSGAGSGQLAGQARELSISISGNGKLAAQALHSERAKVSINGFGDVALWASRDLSVAVAGAGSVEYWGQPIVRRSIAGSADITPRGDKAELRATPVTP